MITRQGSAPGSVPENQDQTQVLARYTASDPERPSVRVTRWSTTGPDGGDFVINALGELRFKNTPDYERPADANRDNVYEVAIRASDGRNTNTLAEVQTVTVTDSRRAAHDHHDQPDRLHPAGEPDTSVLYTFRATDPERSAHSPGRPVGDRREPLHHQMKQRSILIHQPPRLRQSPSDAGTGDNVYNGSPCEARDDRGATPPAWRSRLPSPTTTKAWSRPSAPGVRLRPTGRTTNAQIYTFRATDPQRGNHQLVGNGEQTPAPSSSARVGR